MSLDTKRYAQNLMELARQERREEEYFQQFRMVNDGINRSEELRDYIDSNHYTSLQKRNRLAEVFGNALDMNIMNTFFLINNTINKSHTEIQLIHDFIEHYYHLRGTLFGTAYSVRELDEQSILDLEKAISDRLNHPVKLENKLDEELIGGIKVVVDDYVWDGSYKTRLKNMREELLKDENFDGEEEFGETIKAKIRKLDLGEKVELRTSDTVGYVDVVADGIVKIRGLKKAMAGELLQIGESVAMVMNLEEDSIGAVLLGNEKRIVEGDQVITTGKIVEVPVGDDLLGRVVDALGRPIDDNGSIKASAYYPIERNAPGVVARQSVGQPLETGIKVIDSMIPIGRGQRELIIGDRQTGKTAIAIDTIINQKGKNVKCVYVAIGQKASTVAQIVERLRQHGAMDYTTVVCSSASELAALQYIAPYAGCAIGEYWMENGEDVLIVYDDLSKHAIAYRTLSLLLRRPPGREAYPGDVFYLHSRLLERSAKLSDALGAGSMTALPIVETLAGDISAYIPTNVISITDGQIFLQTELFNSGNRPAVDSGLSVSRVGSAAQSKAMKKVSGALKLQLAQYQEVLDFAQFGSDLDAATKKTIAHGQRLMALLKQPQYSPIAMEDQVIMLFAAQKGYIDDIDVDKIDAFEDDLLRKMHDHHEDIMEEIRTKKIISDELSAKLEELVSDYAGVFRRLNNEA